MEYFTNTTIDSAHNRKPLSTNQSLEQLDFEEFLENDLPVTVLLGLISVVGLIGNSHAILVFFRYQESSVRTLVLRLVIIDLLACIICIPLEIVQIRYTYTYPSSHLCKITRYLTYFTSLTAGTFLIILSVERRQKICAPFKWQLSLVRAKHLSYVVFILCGLVSIPSAFVYDVYNKASYVTGIVGNECAESKHNDKHELSETLYAIIVMTICFFGFFICILAYIQIVNVIRKQIRREKNRTTQYAETILAQESPSSSEVIGRQNSIVDTLDQFTSTLRRRKQTQKRFKDSRTMTIMLLIATGISFFGFILHVTAVIIRTVVRSQDLREINSIYSMLLRAYFLHCAMHPVVYCLVDQRFRQEIKTLYKNLRQFLTARNK